MLTDYTRALDALHVPIGIGDDPLAADEFRRCLTDVGDTDLIREEELAGVGIALIIDVKAFHLNPDPTRRRVAHLARLWHAAVRIICAMAMLVFAFCASPGNVPPFGGSPAGAPVDDGVSIIAVPLHISLEPLLPIIDAAVPKQAEKLDGYELDAQKRFGVRYRMHRSPIAIRMIGAGVHATTTLQYALEGCRRTFNPVTRSHTMWPCGSCGFGERPREAAIALHSALAWDPGWRIRSRTTARPVEFPNRCTVTMLDIDVTDWKIAPLANHHLREIAGTIDRHTPRLADFRPAAERIWAALQEPVEVGPRAWLLVEPREAGFGPITGNGTQLSTTLQLRARTRLIVGERPRISHVPLPQLRLGFQGQHDLHVAADVTIPYSDASRMVSEQVAGRAFDKGRLTIKTISLTPADGGRVAVRAAIDYRGGSLKRYLGDILLVAELALDAPTSTLFLKNVEYSLPSRRDLFFRAVSSLSRDAIREAIETRARSSLSPSLDRMRADVQRASNRTLSPGTQLRTNVKEMRASTISSNPEAIVIRVILTGEAMIDIRAWSGLR